MSHASHSPLIILSGSIGSGKGAVAHALVHELGLTWVPTHTTRTMRKDDATLSRRIYDTEATFLRHKDRGEFIESIELAGHYYGLLRHDLEKELNHGNAVVLELTIEGGLAVAKAYPQALLIFLDSEEKSRRARIQRRGMPAKELEARMKEAKRERKLAEKEYDYIVENPDEDVEEAIDSIKRIIAEEFPELAHN